jgi:pimeloyl-ACP methyl ester carboxylesterase
MQIVGKRIEVGGLGMHVVDEGQGPAVLLLHGFPDSSYLWRHQVPALVGAGHRVVAPDLRGFGDSDKPAAVEAYAIPLIVEDVVGLLDRLQIDRVCVVGHDWGAAVSWLLAAMFPGRVEKLAVLSVGHPNGFVHAGIEQREKSWYMLLFQFEGIAEEMLRANDWQMFRDWTRHHAEGEQWVASLSRPGALTAALNWYRANVHPRDVLAQMQNPEMGWPPCASPTLGVWSAGDAYLTEEQMTASSRFVSGGWRYERFDQASHWIPLDAADRLNRLLVEFLAE